MPDNPTETTLAKAPDRGPVSVIGPYRLHQIVGSGGMGEVWRAEQTEPIHRTVALKLIKSGMDTRAVVAGFDSERQALVEHLRDAVSLGYKDLDHIRTDEDLRALRGHTPFEAFLAVARKRIDAPSQQRH